MVLHNCRMETLLSAANLLIDPDVITVEQFLDMDLPDSCEWLLINGTVVSVTHARFPHSRIQSNITFREWDNQERNAACYIARQFSCLNRIGYARSSDAYSRRSGDCEMASVPFQDRRRQPAGLF